MDIVSCLGSITMWLIVVQLSSLTMWQVRYSFWRLKVYEALFLMVTRDFKKAGELFLDSTATFGAYVSAFFFLYCTRFLLDCIGHHCCLLCCVSTYARIHAALAYLLMQTP